MLVGHAERAWARCGGRLVAINEGGALSLHGGLIVPTHDGGAPSRHEASLSKALSDGMAGKVTDIGTVAMRVAKNCSFGPTHSPSEGEVLHQPAGVAGDEAFDRAVSKEAG